MDDRNLQTWVGDQLHALIGERADARLFHMCLSACLGCFHSCSSYDKHLTSVTRALASARDLRQLAEMQPLTDWLSSGSCYAGMAEGVLAKYIVSLARKAGSSSQLAVQLQGQVTALQHQRGKGTLTRAHPCCSSPTLLAPCRQQQLTVPSAASNHPGAQTGHL